jgi:putative restriction endonuclease
MYDWKQEATDWLNHRRVNTPKITDECILFFQTAFKYTRRPDKAWFGAHKGSLSLVVGGIFLAAAVASGIDKGLWLLVDNDDTPLEGWEYSPAQSTMHSPAPLFWLHTAFMHNVSAVLGNQCVWESYSLASKKIFLARGIASDRDNTQLKRGKKRLADFWRERPVVEAELATAETNLAKQAFFDPTDIVDAREHVISAIVRRRGQPAFRQKLLAAYRGKCAITGFDAIQTLEAAHIIPYLGPQTNHPSNGLLLRADIHILFDLGLISIDTETMTVLVAPQLSGTTYATLAGRTIFIPEDEMCRPSIDALNSHRRSSGLL